MPKWIDLNDASGARLKIAPIKVDGEEQLHLFITGLSFSDPKFDRVISELGFKPSPELRCLVRRAPRGETLKPSMFRAVFPRATSGEMSRDSYILSTAPSATADVGTREVHAELSAVDDQGERAMPAPAN